jgi:N,N'-diacetyllegionaminate synthase
MKCFFIAEAGVNHNGQESLAMELIDAAAKSGADAIKFQSFKADKLVTESAKKAEYQAKATGDGSQLSMLKRLEMCEDMHQSLFAHCEAKGIEFMSTPFDDESADFLVELGIKRIKVPSGEINNHPFIAHLASKNLPLIVSTGMANMAEIHEAVAVIKQTRKQLGFTEPLAQKLTILHCTSNYPAACEDVNLRAMNSIAKETGMPVGYSDHTLGVAVSTGAVALGASVIEKHFTLDRNMDGPDHKASLEPDELTTLINHIRDIEKALGSDVKQPADSELPVRELVRKSATVLKTLPQGHVLSADDIVLMRPGHGIKPKEVPGIIGKALSRDIEPGTTLTFDDIVADSANA